jgi:putative ABC transport system substrate-binding protein
LEHPDGNVTGVAGLPPAAAGRQLELLKEAVPGVSRVAVIWSSHHLAHRLMLQSVKDTAQNLGVEVVPVDVDDAAGFEAALRKITNEHADGLITLGGPSTYCQAATIANFAATNHLPAVYAMGEFGNAGGLLTCGLNLAEEFRGPVADYVDQILKGAKPADLPVVQPTTFCTGTGADSSSQPHTVVNLGAAKSQGITIPPSIIQRAHATIE